MAGQIEPIITALKNYSGSMESEGVDNSWRPASFPL
jgi:hypothetical protein